MNAPPIEKGGTKKGEDNDGVVEEHSLDASKVCCRRTQERKEQEKWKKMEIWDGDVVCSFAHACSTITYSLKIA